MNTQEIKNALRDLEPEEAAQIARDILRDTGHVLKLWSKDDISSILDQDPESTELDADQRERVLELAFEDTTFQNLEDATDQDWDAISQAIDSALVAVKG